VVKILPNIEKMEKNNDNFIEVLFCFKYVMNPAAEEDKIMKVEVSIAMFIGIINKIVIILTNNTPPPIPAITAITPAKNPKDIKIGIIMNVISIEEEKSNSS
jgi:hypothetical protein